MKLLSLLDRLSTADAPADATPRRDLLQRLGQASARAAVAALPLAAALPAQAALADTTLDAILLLLKLEDLLIALYTQALASPALSGGAQATVRPDFERMLRHQQGHAQFYRTTLLTAGLTPPTAPSFDFSGRRNNPGNPELFPNVLNDYNSFLQLAQQLEDASASIYLNQVATFSSDRQLRDVVLRTQSVEARHASHLRTLRRANGTAVKSWPSNADVVPTPTVVVPSPTGGSAAPVSIYTFEANETQLVSATAAVPFLAVLNGATAVQFVALSEAFDEPLPTAQATALLNVFG